MKIEVGKFYRLKSGCKLYVACSVPRNPFVTMSHDGDFDFICYIQGVKGEYRYSHDGMKSGDRGDGWSVECEWAEPLGKAVTAVLLNDGHSYLMHGHMTPPSTGGWAGWKHATVFVQPGDKG